jgi:hypothetical protein
VVISGFEWDDGNVDHIERHGLTPEEVEEVLLVTARSDEPARAAKSR